MSEATAPAPRELGRANAHDLRVVWDDGVTTVIGARALRLACPCAACVDELTGRRMLTEGAVPADVHPVKVGLVGRYAVHVAFSDGHASGIFTFERLRALAPAVPA